MTYDKSYSNCKGCRSLNHNVAGRSMISILCCLHMKFNYAGDCPCSLCLIKMMCDKPCAPFDLYNRECDVKRSDTIANVNKELSML